MTHIRFRQWLSYSKRFHYWGFKGFEFTAPIVTLEFERELADAEMFSEMFTGSQDKNGKDMFEGDVVKCANGSEGVWIWGNKQAAWRLDTTQTKNGWSHPIESFDSDTIEIIGNIYENPELTTK